MEVRLLVSPWCPTCPRAEAVWDEVAKQQALDYRVVDVSKPEGRALAHDLRIRSVPAVVVNGKLQGVGVQSVEEALTIIQREDAQPAGSV